MVGTVTCSMDDSIFARYPDSQEFCQRAGFLISSSGGPFLGDLELEFVRTPKAVEFLLDLIERKESQTVYFMIRSISPAGVTLYYVVERGGMLSDDFTIFVPMSNIAAIHVQH